MHTSIKKQRATKIRIKTSIFRTKCKWRQKFPGENHVLQCQAARPNSVQAIKLWISKECNITNDMVNFH